MNDLLKSLKRMLGLNQDDVWQEFALDIGAQFVPSHIPLLGVTYKIYLNSEVVNIILDTYYEKSGDMDELYTRAISYDIDCGGFSLILRKKDFWDVLKFGDRFDGDENWYLLNSKGFLSEQTMAIEQCNCYHYRGLWK